MVVLELYYLRKLKFLARILKVRFDTDHVFLLGPVGFVLPDAETFTAQLVHVLHHRVQHREEHKQLKQGKMTYYSPLKHIALFN